jgi:hypothetical protein
MSETVTIDGSGHTGTYQVQCDCGLVWTGCGESTGVASWSPALPIAECVVHMKLTHPRDFVDLRMTERFRNWLSLYWEQASTRLAAQKKRAGLYRQQRVLS